MLKLLRQSPVLDLKNLRIMVFFIAIGFVFWADFSIGKVMFDEDSVYPFLCLILVPFSVAVKIGLSAIALVRRACVSVGIIVCCMNSLALLGDFTTDTEEYYFATRLIYAPLALGILSSYLLSIIEPQNLKEPSFSMSEKVLIFAFFVSMIIVSWNLVSEAKSLTPLINIPSILMVFVIALIFSVHKNVSHLSVIGKINQAAMFTVIIAAVSGVAWYVYIIGIDDAQSIGPVIATALCAMLYGSLMSNFSISIGGQRHLSERDGVYYDWHLIEAYVFYGLILFPPLSLGDIVFAS